MLAILAYSLAVAIPVFLLYHFGPRHWYWHLLAVAAGFGLGFLPMPPDLQKRGFDMALGCALVLLLFWGLGGLILPRRPRVKHA
jgi:hypothetical protein